MKKIKKKKIGHKWGLNTQPYYHKSCALPTELTSNTENNTEIIIKKCSCQPLCWTTVLLSRDHKKIVPLSQENNMRYLKIKR